MSLENRDPQPAGREVRSSRDPLLGTVMGIHRGISESSQDWNSVMQGRSGFAEVAYQNGSFINRFMESTRRVPEMVRLAVSFNHRPHSQRRISIDAEATNRDDIFNQRRSGISLADIEKMPLPLSDGDIKAITKMLFERRFHRPSNIPPRSAMLFTIYNKADSDGRSVPRSLMPLYRRTTDFLDYYSSLMLNFSQDPIENTKLMWWLFRGEPNLPNALGAYIPASLGISPASTIKALHQKLESLDRGRRFGVKKYVKKYMEPEAREAYRRGALPDELSDYVHYSEANDNRAESHIDNFYSGLTNQQLTDSREEAESLTQKASLYFKRTFSDIMKSPGKSLVFPMGPDHVVKDVVLTSQDRRVLMFIMRFNDEQTHLLIELDRDGTFYGFPPKLANGNQMVMYAALRDLFSSFVDFAAANHPEVEKEDIKPYGLPKPSLPEDVIKEEPQIYVPRPKKRRERRLPRLQTPLANLLTRGEPELPSGESSSRKFVVIASRGQIEGALGRHPRPKDVERIIREIRDFEYGKKPPYRTITWSEGERTVLRAGDFRIILNHLRGKFFSLDVVGDRKYVYSNFSDNL